MWYVYVLRSKKDKNLYIGSTNDLHRRWNEHRYGKNISTAKRRPLELVTYVALPTEQQAREVERYFKSGSGSVILRKRILMHKEQKQA
jgi:predicted GIY-YIG superfamily endonuclease